MRRRRSNLADLEPCPKCGKLGGERRASVNVPDRYFVRCRVCGYAVQSMGGTSNATRLWNEQSRRGGAR